MSNKYPAISEVYSRLESIPKIPIVQKENSLVIEPEASSGFRSGLVDNIVSYMVFHDGWHTDQFKTFEDAAKLFLFGLTAAARIFVKQRGRLRYYWEFETYADGNWAGIEMTGLLFFPFWRKKETYYLQNDWIKIEQLQPWIGLQFSDCKLNKYNSSKHIH